MTEEAGPHMTHYSMTDSGQTRAISIQLSLMFSILEFSAPSRLLLILLSK